MDYKNKFEKHVAVLAFPFATHPGLLLGLLRKLANASPKSIIFSFFSTSRSNTSLFSIKSSPSDQNGDENIKAFDVADGVPEGYKFMGRPQEDIDLFLEVAEENFKKGVEEAEKTVGIKVSCVVADAFLWFSGEMAAELKVPWIPVWTSGANSLSVHVYTELIRQTVGLDGVSGREDEILTFVPGFPELRLGDLPSGVVLGRLESPFSIMLYKMGQILPKLAHALPMNSFEELDPPILKDLKSNFKNVLNIGPFNLTSPPPSANISDVHGCIPWLDNQKTGQVAYIGFGTVASPPPHELKAMAEALEATRIPFIWSLKENMKSHLPEGFLERTSETGKVVPWAPQVQILSHDSVGVFLNHCGWNSVLESIAAGVPIISRPFFGDHQINTWMVEKVWKIGVRIKGGSFTKDATINAIDLVLKREEGKRLKDQIVSYKKLGMEAVGPNGSSTKNFETLVKIIAKA